MGAYHKKNIKIIPIIILAVSLIFSFGLHAVQVKHVHAHAEHPHESESSVQVFLGEYMHLSDKKVFVMVVTLGVALWYVLESVRVRKRLFYISDKNFRVHGYYLRFAHRTINYLCTYLGNGVLHSKAY